MSSVSPDPIPSPARRVLFVSLLGFVVVSILTFLGKAHPAGLSLAVLISLLLPLIWAWRTRGWAGMGFTTHGIGPALLWGTGGGVLSALIGVLVIGEVRVPDDLAAQLALAVPMWLLIASPFQEFFFRGWLQSRLTAALGVWPGLLVTLACFTLWHFALPIFGPQSAYPMFTLRGIAGVIASGLIYGVVFQRTRSILAPWLAHAIAGIVFVVIGAATFLPPAP